MNFYKSEKTVDHVSLYLTHLAFGFPTGGNALFRHVHVTKFNSAHFTCMLSTISSHYKIKKQDSCNGHVANPLQGETKWECTKCELSPCHQKGYINNGIVEVPEESDCREVTVSPVAVSSKYTSRFRSRRVERKTRTKSAHQPQAMPQATLQAILKNIHPQAMPKAMLQANLKKYLPSGYAWGYASGKIFPQATPQATLQAILNKYSPSGYALGYASGKIFIAAGYAPGYASGNFKKIFTLWLRPRLCFRQI
ncbi:hypothetical protein T06_4895 [Trichinella sp. T6]|nr:hypothetical protein T06_4895 [Trichinella sp. T6]